MVVNTRVGVIYKLASGNFGRIESACRYPLYFQQENVETSSIARIFSWNATC